MRSALDGVVTIVGYASFVRLLVVSVRDDVESTARVLNEGDSKSKVARAKLARKAIRSDGRDEFVSSCGINECCISLEILLQFVRFATSNEATKVFESWFSDNHKLANALKTRVKRHMKAFSWMDVDTVLSLLG